MAAIKILFILFGDAFVRKKGSRMGKKVKKKRGGFS
jgi:hypothetical protein